MITGRFAEQSDGSGEQGMIDGAENCRGGADGLDAATPVPGRDSDAPARGHGELCSPGSSTRSLGYVRTVAQFGVQVAEALDHAHTRGIHHRDIKPGNLLLDAQDQLWVTDFGLAHVQGNTCLTLTGDVLGTLRYMSPEQELARRVLIDGRTDIYSLGVTLYELLTLRPAVDGKDRSEIMRRIAEEEPAPVRKLNSAVPRDLETVILKAISKEPSGRYATAKELADELRRFLEHRPIISRAPNLLDRAAKWARRHRYAVWSGSVSLAALLILSVVGLAVSNVLISREKDRKDAALREKGQALREREAALAAVGAREHEARANLRLARKAVDGLYTQLAEELYALPRMQPLQRKLLIQALEFYEEFSAQNGSDPEIRFETVRAYRRVGSIQHLLGRRRGSISGPEAGHRLLETLAKEFPIDARYRAELASAYSTLGFTLVDTGETRPGSEAYRRRRSSWRVWHPNRRHAPICANGYPYAYRRLGTLPGIPTLEAEQALRSAVRICQNLVAEFPDNPLCRADLVTSLEHLGYVLTGSGLHREAEQAFREAIADYGTSLAPSHRRELLVALNRGLAGVLNRAGRPDDAVEVLRRAVALSEAALVGSPDAAERRADLIPTLRILAATLQRTQRPLEAIEAFEKALAFYDTETERSPSDLQRPLGKADVLNELGRLLAEERQPAKAREAFQNASDICEKLAAQVPYDPAIGREFQADCYFQWTRALAAARPAARRCGNGPEGCRTLREPGRPTIRRAGARGGVLPVAARRLEPPPGRRARRHGKSPLRPRTLTAGRWRSTRSAPCSTTTWRGSWSPPKARRRTTRRRQLSSPARRSRSSRRPPTSGTRSAWPITAPASTTRRSPRWRSRKSWVVGENSASTPSSWPFPAGNLVSMRRPAAGSAMPSGGWARRNPTTKSYAASVPKQRR